GSLLNTLDFHNGVTIASLSKSANCYVAKYSSTGVCQWARGDISLSNDRNKGMALDAAGNLLVYGHFNQLINKAGNVNNLFSYETPPVASTSGTQLMFAKYSPAGVHLWSQAVRGTKDLVGTSIQYNTAGGFIYCTGAFNNTSTIDGQTMTWSGGANNYHDWFVGRFTDLDNCTMTASLTTTAPACNGSNGALSAIVSGGAAPYTYRWSDGSAASSLSGLSAGAYTVTVKDTLGCAATASVQLGFRISTTIASTVTCAGGTNGSAKATVYGGSGPYTYSWSANAGAASQNNNLPGGSQSVTVTDGSGCALTANFNMPQPGIIKSIMFHSNDSIWVAAPLYGTGPFIYQWSTGSTATGIGNCSYTTPYWVKVTDSKGCISPQDTTIITEPAHWVWVTPGKSSTSSSNISAMLASDASGHLYSAGIISNTVTIGTYTVNGGPSGIPYLAKFDSVGVPVWIKTYGTTIYIRDNETDAAGNIYITGTLSGTATFGSFTLTSSGSGDMFLVKYNSAGTALWASRSSGAGFEFGQALTTDAAGNIYVGGDFSGAGTWGVYSYTASSQDMFVAKYNGSTGACMWAKKGGGTGNEYIRSMTIESSGNILVLTDFNQSPTFGSFTLNSNGQSDIGVVRYNASSGLEQMAMSFGSLRNDASTDIVSDPSGNYYVSLSLSDTIPFATDTVTLDASNNSAAVIKFSSAGAYLGYYQVHGFGASYLAGMAMSSTGELYLSAYYNRKIQLEGNYYLLARNYNPVSSSEDIAIIKIDPVTMRVLWVNSTGGKATDYGTVLTMNKGDNALYGYSYSMGNNLEYDPFILNSQLLSTLDAVWGRLTDIPALGASYTAAAPTCNNGANGSATVTPTGGLAPYTYAWSPGSYTTQTVNTLSPGNYTVTVTDAAMNIFNVTVSISNPAPVTVNGNAALSSICSGDSTTITASGASTYSWAPPAGLSATSGTVVTADPTATTSYTITGTNALGCSNTATVTLTVNTTPAVSASAVTATICSGSSVTLNGSGAATYSWQPGNLSGNNVSVSPAATATYTLTGTSSGCSDTTSVTVNVLMTPTVSYTESTTVVCSGDGPFALTPGTPAGGVYSGAGVSGNTFDPWTAGTGTITVTYAWTDTVNSCTGTASSAIVVNTCVGMAGAGNIPGISASPNPFSASLRIEGVRGLTLVKLTNALGEMIYSGTIHSASVINTAELVNGVYFLHLETEGEITIRKMVKQE
ncbi:MAG: T9SS type A sorting domain-containing protein, partial [Bacteroidia bacterium]